MKELAAVYEKNNKLKDAINYYEKLYDADKRDIKTMSKLAGLYYKNSNLNEAYNLYLNLLKVDPTSDFAADAALKLNELKHKLK